MSIKIILAAVLLSISSATYSRTKWHQNNVSGRRVILTQELVNKETANSVFNIEKDYSLSEDVKLPANCRLYFNGGTLNGNHKVIGLCRCEI